MHKRVKQKKIKKIGILSICLFSIVSGFLFFAGNRHDFVPIEFCEHVTIIDDGHVIVFNYMEQNNVSGALALYDETIGENDLVFPERSARLFSDDVIIVEREKKVTVAVDDTELVLTTYRDTLDHILMQNDVVLDDNDIIVPDGTMIVTENVEAKITRVIYEQNVIKKDIPFQKIVKEDDSVNFLKSFTEQEGKNGIKEITYNIAYHDGEEVARDVISENVTKEPIDEVIVQGTQVKLGKSHSGGSSWYAYTGTMSAANPWLPIGSYVKVTNKANGKSVIVRINDRGPFVAGRIVDLDKVAFQKIASLGAGVIDVKMEEIIN